MIYWIFLISTLALTHCRPQLNTQEPAVEYITFLTGPHYLQWSPPKTSPAFTNAPRRDTTEDNTSAPYRAHPLFHFLKNKNTINTDRIISFRKDSSDDKITTLILKPVAKAVAGIEGKAISTPMSRAILRQGTNVDILFEPEAVAIAGPGGIAHAQSDLEIIYDDIIAK